MHSWPAGAPSSIPSSNRGQQDADSSGALRLTAALGLATLGFVLFPLSAAESAAVSVTIQADKPGAKIDRNLYGQFAEHLGHGIYEGIWVGEGSSIPNTRGYRNDVVAALKKLKVPVVRWPGGCFADEYHWREGIGPRDKRPVKVNTHWGAVEEPNSFGTHEFLDFAELIGADAYVSGQRRLGLATGNGGVGRVHHVRYEVDARRDASCRTVAISLGSCRTSVWAMKPGAAAATCARNISRICTSSSRRSSKAPRDNQSAEDRQRRECRRLSLDGSDVVAGGQAHGRVLAALLHVPRSLGEQGSCDWVH